MLTERFFNFIKSYVNDALDNIWSDQADQDYEKAYDEYNYSKTNQSTTTSNTEEKYYKYLDLPNGSSFEEIKKAYKREMKKYHPDKFHGNPQKQAAAEKLSQKINEAYSYFEKKYADI